MIDAAPDVLEVKGDITPLASHRDHGRLHVRKQMQGRFPLAEKRAIDPNRNVIRSSASRPLAQLNIPDPRLLSDGTVHLQVARPGDLIQIMVYDAVPPSQQRARTRKGW